MLVKDLLAELENLAKLTPGLNVMRLEIMVSVDAETLFNPDVDPEHNTHYLITEGVRPTTGVIHGTPCSFLLIDVVHEIESTDRESK